MAGTIALVQTDIKRVLAYSTVSQLGYMVMAMGVGAYGAGIFHLYTHAFFKALLFLGAGAVIHALAGEQDLRRMGGLRKQLPITYWTFLVGAIAIAGVPGLAGFFSKDEILYRTFMSGHRWLWGVGVVTSFLTAVYMFRLVFLAFHGDPQPAAGPAAAHGGHGGGEANAPQSGHGDAAHRHLHDAPPAMALALVVLAAGSIVAGYVGLPHALGGSNRFEQFLAPSFAAHQPADGAAASGEPEAAAGHGSTGSTATELTLMAISSAVALAGIGLAAYFFLQRRDAAGAIADRFKGAYSLLLHKYYVDEIYDTAVVQPIRIIAEDGLWKNVDVRGIDRAVNGVGAIVAGSSSVLRRLQTGSVQAYAASLFVGVVVVLGYYLWR
jgi:NADH-quinone oxidoreductase subunit L